ncbi:MAG: hypothetical protein MZU97_08840 [Bacillus subtilis]|nr:hypothetical protein [Bacillus subtilis]
MKIFWVFLAGLMIVITGCVPGAGDKDKDKKAAAPVERIISKDEAVSELPCFKCHEYKDYTAGAGKGSFSHTIHAKTGYHCNQCHDLKAHKLSADISRRLREMPQTAGPEIPAELVAVCPSTMTPMPRGRGAGNATRRSSP